MFQITISGNTTDELKANAASVSALLNGASTKTVAALSASEQARLRGDATVVPPKDKAPTAAEKKAAEKAAKEAAKKAAEEAEAESDDTVEDDDPLEENESGGDDEESLTNEDVKNLLLEVKKKYPKDATLISKIVQEQGKAKKISEVEDANLPAVAKRCRELLAKAK